MKEQQMSANEVIRKLRTGELKSTSMAGSEGQCVDCCQTIEVGYFTNQEGKLLKVVSRNCSH